MDERLRAGDRRNGPLLYRPTCPHCDACRPLRLDADRFVRSRAHQRIVRNGDATLTVEAGPPTADAERVALYNAHLVGRGLTRGNAPIDLDGYQHFLADTCCDTFELRYRCEGQLVGVAITDRSANALSAVYCYYDPAYARLSIGTYSILKQVELCTRLGLRHLYLGLYVVGSAIMAYKARFFPHEQRVADEWREVRDEAALASLEHMPAHG